MAGRGRGRGMSFSVEALGFSRGEALPPPILQPPPLFPPLEAKPVPLLTGEVEDYILALKQELRGTFQDSGFCIQPASKKKDVRRYSDRYQQRALSGEQALFDWKRFPKELHPPVPKRKARKEENVSSVSKKKKPKKNVDVGKKLEELEAAERNSSEEEDKDEEKKDEEDDKELEEDIEEEELEEETDYAFNYFDNGENYLDEDDDNLDDGPTY